MRGNMIPDNCISLNREQKNEESHQCSKFHHKVYYFFTRQVGGVCELTSKLRWSAVQLISMAFSAMENYKRDITVIFFF